MKTILLLGITFLAFSWAAVPANGVSPCDILYLRKDCMDAVCGSQSLKTSLENYVSVPQSTSRSPDAPPADTATIVTFTVKNLYGTYSDKLYNSTDLHLFVDGQQPNLGLGIQVKYDWTGDGSWDRTENLHTYATDVQFGTYQDVNTVSAGRNLFSVTGSAYTNFNKGSIQILVWSAYLVNGTLSVATDRRSWIRIPYVSSYSSNNVAPATCNIATTQAAPSQPAKVAFIFNNVQDYYLAETAMAVMDVFNSTPFTMGIIGGSFGEHIALRGKIGAALEDKKRKLEIACNAYDSGDTFDITALTLQQQVDQLSHCITKGDTSLNVAITSYIPRPAGEKTIGLRKAALLAGYNAISIPQYLDAAPYATQNSDIYRWPSAAGTYGDNEAPVPATTTFAQLQNQISVDGFGVVDMNPEEFTLGADRSGGPNWDQIAQLRSLIAMVKAQNYSIVLLSEMSSDPRNVTTVYEDTNCNCVAFRLDDVQDYYLAPAQRAVIETFEAKGAPLTIGIIGNSFGEAPTTEPNNMLLFLRNQLANSSASSCYKLEVAHHGWLHEDFSSLTLPQQQTALQNGINKINARLGITPTTFLPPFNLFNANTLAALNITGFKTLTSQTDIDLPPYTYTNPKWGLKRFPVGASTSAYKSSDYFIGVPAEVTYAQIKEQIAQYGWSSVMMHPQEYTNRYNATTYLDTIIPAQLSELEKLIDMLRRDGIRLTNVNSIQNWFGKADVVDPCLTGRIVPVASSASSSATTAASSATTAASSATTAASSATTAASSATTAASSATTAASSATTAASSATTEATSATTAASSATTAASSATTAASSATTAASSATTAASSATTAASSATSVASSATSAATSATSAPTSAPTTATSATSAPTTATSAPTTATSATSAPTTATSATSAPTSAPTTATSATSAPTSAPTTATSATTAGTSATTATSIATSRATNSTARTRSSAPADSVEFVSSSMVLISSIALIAMLL